MDQELRDAFKSVGETISSNCGRLDGKLDSMRGDFTNHLVESAGRWSTIKEQTEAAHRRIDSHKEEHKGTSVKLWALWTAVGVALVGGLGTFVIKVVEMVLARR